MKSKRKVLHHTVVKKTKELVGADFDLPKMPHTMTFPLSFPKLPVKRKIFIHRYLTHKNASKAYREAYPDAKAHTAQVESSKLLANPVIRAIVQEGLNQEYRELALSREKILKRTSEFAFDGPRDKIAAVCLDMLKRHFGLYDENQHVDKDPTEDDSEAYEVVKLRAKPKIQK